MKKVILFTASFGEGHNQTAWAVHESLVKRGAHVKVIDYLDWIRPSLRRATQFGLVKSVQKFPSLYGAFYRYMSNLSPSSLVNRKLNQLGLVKMQDCLNSLQPDVVACTFPTPAGVLSELREMGLTDVPTAAIITDFTANRQWVHAFTDKYFAASESVKQELILYGVPVQDIEVSGIPIRSMFTNAVDKASLRQRHHIDKDQLLILVMGGGEGIFRGRIALEQILTTEHARFVILCGRNARLYKRLQRFQSERVQVLGYVQNMSDWMAMADLIITKPGGVTVSESLSMELPMLLFQPIPGQEEMNAEHAVKTGAAVLADDVDAVLSFIQEITNNPLRLQGMRAAARLAASPTSAGQVADAILELSAKDRVGKR